MKSGRNTVADFVLILTVVHCDERSRMLRIDQGVVIKRYSTSKSEQSKNSPQSSKTSSRNVKSTTAIRKRTKTKMNMNSTKTMWILILTIISYGEQLSTYGSNNATKNRDQEITKIGEMLEQTERLIKSSSKES